MAIDPSIILGLKTDPVLDPASILTKAAQYRNLISETAYRDQELKTNQANQARIERQNAEADRKAQGDKLEGELIAKNTQTTPDGEVITNHDAVRQGLDAAGHGELAGSYLTRVQIPNEKALLENQKNKIANAKSKLDTVGQVLQSLTNTPDEQLPAAYDQNNQQLTEQGLLKPGEVPSAAQVMQQGGVQALKQYVAQHAQSAMTADQQVTAHQKDLDYMLKLKDQQHSWLTDAPKTAEAWTKQASQALSAATSPEQWATAQRTLIESGAPLGLVAQFGEFGQGAQERAANMGMTPKERADLANQQATLTETQKRDAETARANAAREAETARSNRASESAKSAEIALQAKKFAAEFGGDAVKGWAKTIQDNPDAVSEVPAALRNGVQQEFTKTTGLPFPKPLSGQTKTQETAARNGLSALQQLNEDLKDPEIQSRIGPILGRLGNAEQDVGTTAGLSPEAAAKAQRLRTNMRYLVFQEGKALLGGRLPQSLMKELESSSPNTHMDVPTLQGALQGVQDGALRVLDAADQERFGGKMRSRQDRGVSEIKFGPKMVKMQAPNGQVSSVPESQVEHYKSKGAKVIQ